MKRILSRYEKTTAASAPLAVMRACRALQVHPDENPGKRIFYAGSYGPTVRLKEDQTVLLPSLQERNRMLAEDGETCSFTIAKWEEGLVFVSVALPGQEEKRYVLSAQDINPHVTGWNFETNELIPAEEEQD